MVPFASAQMAKKACITGLVYAVQTRPHRSIADGARRSGGVTERAFCSFCGALESETRLAVKADDCWVNVRANVLRGLCRSGKCFVKLFFLSKVYVHVGMCEENVFVTL